MSEQEYQEMAEFIYQDLRLRTLPVGTKFFSGKADWPERTRRPKRDLKRRIAICQAMTLARLYRWTVGMDHKDLNCGPAMLLFGLTKSEDPRKTLADFFARVGWSADAQRAGQESAGFEFFPKNSISSMVFAPVNKGLFVPDTVTIFGNPAQIMRAVQAWSYMDGNLVKAGAAGRASCSEYLIAPYLTGEARMAMPGNGDRVMSMTQDEEMAFALPGSELSKLVEGLQTAGRTVGARYPVAFYQDFEPRFPPAIREFTDQIAIDA